MSKDVGKALNEVDYFILGYTTTRIPMKPCVTRGFLSFEEVPDSYNTITFFLNDCSIPSPKIIFVGSILKETSTKDFDRIEIVFRSNIQHIFTTRNLCEKKRREGLSALLSWWKEGDLYFCSRTNE